MSKFCRTDFKISDEVFELRHPLVSFDNQIPNLIPLQFEELAGIRNERRNNSSISSSQGTCINDVKYVS